MVAKSDTKILVLDKDGHELNRIARRDAQFLLKSEAAALVQLEPLIIKMKADMTSTEAVKVLPAKPQPTVIDTGTGLSTVTKLTRDIKNASATLTDREARYLVDTYYQMQDQRIRAGGQVRSMGDTQEPHQTLAFFAGQAETLEDQVKRALDAYSLSSEVGRWSRSVCGIGPVIAAGLMAHIDIAECETAGTIWRFAGLDPTVKWKGSDDCRTWLRERIQGQPDLDDVIMAAKHWGRDSETLLRFASTDIVTGEAKKLTIESLASALARRPWNASLKTLCWKIGESFIKVKGREDGVYGHLYAERKAYEQQKNAAGDYKDLAERILASKNFRGDTVTKRAYQEGRLSDGHIHARARRWAVKIFLSHWHEVAYLDHFKKAPPAPFAIAILGHAHKIDPQRNAA